MSALLATVALVSVRLLALVPYVTTYCSGVYAILETSHSIRAEVKLWTVAWRFVGRSGSDGPVKGSNQTFLSFISFSDILQN